MPLGKWLVTAIDIHGIEIAFPEWFEKMNKRWCNVDADSDFNAEPYTNGMCAYGGRCAEVDVEFHTLTGADDDGAVLMKIFTLLRRKGSPVYSK